MYGCINLIGMYRSKVLNCDTVEGQSLLKVHERFSQKLMQWLFQLIDAISTIFYQISLWMTQKIDDLGRWLFIGTKILGLSLKLWLIYNGFFLN